MPNAEWHNFVIPIGTALIGYALGRRASRLNRLDDINQKSSDRRRKFREEVRLIQQRLEPLDWRKFQAAWQGTLADFEAACVRVAEDIPKDRRDGFLSARERYINRKQADGKYPAGKGYPESPVRPEVLGEIERDMQRRLTPILREILQDAQ